MTTMGIADLEQRLVQLISADKVKVPAYPAIAMQLKQLTQKEDINFDEIVQLVHEDQAIAATILRWANSAASGAGRVTSSIQQAVQRLGLKKIGQIAISAGLQETATASGPLDSLKFLLWRRAVLSSLLCHELALFRHEDQDEAFTAGLLHDFGQNIALAALEMLAADGTQMRFSAERWRQLADQFHIELGLVLAARWQLPEPVATLIARHHDPAQSTPLAAMVRIVDQVNDLLEQKDAIEAEDLAGMEDFVDDKEREMLLAFMPGAIDLLTLMVEPPRPVKVMVPDEAARLIEPQAQALKGKICPVEKQVLLRKHSGEQRFAVKAIGGEGLVLRGSQPLKENSLEKITLQAEGEEDFDFCVAVQLCKRDDDGNYHLEVKPFGLGGNAKQRWRKLCERSVVCDD